MISSLTTFRFITAFIVFLFHCAVHLKWKTSVHWVDAFLGNGATFMTGFFVLSGFIMTHVYKKADISHTEGIYAFYFKRFAKIYPTYILATLVYFIFLPVSSDLLPRVIANDLFLVQGFYPSMFRIGLNGGTWSLTVEMFLYFLFPLLIIISNRSPKILIFACLAGCLVSLNMWLDPSDYAYANPVFRLCDFAYGIGFYYLKDRFKAFPHAHLAIVPLLVIACIYLGSSTYRYMLGQAIIAPLFGLWIASLFHTSSRFYNSRVLEYLGLISYSFYLWQFAALEIGKYILKHHPDTSTHIVVLCVFTVNIVISILSYHMWEERIRRLILRKYAKPQSRVQTA